MMVMVMMMMVQLFLLTTLIKVKISVSQNVITLDHIPVQQGKSIIIPCLYDANYINHLKYLCFGFKYFCKDVKQLKPKKVSISDDRKQHIFTATLKNVTTREAGSYWCSVETSGFDVKKDIQLKVTTATPELYVDDQMVTGYEGSHVVIFCHHQTRKPKAWCKISGPCVSTTGNIHGATVQLRSTDQGFSVTMSELTMDNTGWYWCSAGDQQMPVYITVQNAVPNWERSSFAWLILLGSLLAIACIAVIVFRKHKQKCEMLSSCQKSETAYVSMKKPNLQTKQHEDEEEQDYETMSAPEQKLGAHQAASSGPLNKALNPQLLKWMKQIIVQGMNTKVNVTPKSDGGHITNKNDVLEGPYCTC